MSTDDTIKTTSPLVIATDRISDYAAAIEKRTMSLLDDIAAGHEISDHRVEDVARLTNRDAAGIKLEINRISEVY